MKTFALALILIICPVYSQSTHVGSEEASLMKACSKNDLPSCETLGAYYINKENWEKATIVGKALCGQDLPLGCTYAGIALMAKGEAKEGNSFLTKACDKFEPYACRSLGRIMKKVEEANLSHLYFRRACHYGLDEICFELKKGKTIFSKAGLDFIKKIQEDCSDTHASICSERLASLSTCAKPLTAEDCVLLPGHLSIYFRAKLMQAEAKFSLLSLVASEKKLKNDPHKKSYSYDLSSVFKDYKALNKYLYVFGFMKACSGKSNATSIELFPEAYKSLPSRVTVNVRNYFSKGKSSDCYTLTGGFEAFAVANLDKINQSRLDVWKIDQDGNLLHILDGLPIP